MNLFECLILKFNLVGMPFCQCCWCWTCSWFSRVAKLKNIVYHHVQQHGLFLCRTLPMIISFMGPQALSTLRGDIHFSWSMRHYFLMLCLYLSGFRDAKSFLDSLPPVVSPVSTSVWGWGDTSSYGGLFEIVEASSFVCSSWGSVGGFINMSSLLSD